MNFETNSAHDKSLKSQADGMPEASHYNGLTSSTIEGMHKLFKGEDKSSDSTGLPNLSLDDSINPSPSAANVPISGSLPFTDDKRGGDSTSGVPKNDDSEHFIHLSPIEEGSSKWIHLSPIEEGRAPIKELRTDDKAGKDSLTINLNETATQTAPTDASQGTDVPSPGTFFSDKAGVNKNGVKESFEVKAAKLDILLQEYNVTLPHSPEENAKSWAALNKSGITQKDLDPILDAARKAGIEHR